MTDATAVPDNFGNLELPKLNFWRELAIFGLILMDLSWTVPWFQTLSGTQDSLPRWEIFLVLGLITIGANLLARFTNYFNLKVRYRRLLLVAYFFLTVGLALRLLLYSAEPTSLGDLIMRPIREMMDLTNLFPVELFVVLAVLFLSWRGIHLAQDFIGPLKVMGNFRLGFLMFLAYILFVSLLTGDSLGWSWVIFLFAGLVAIGAARVLILGLRKGARRSPFNRDWFLGMIFVVLATIGLAAAITVLAVGLGPIIVGILFRIMLILLLILIAPFALVLTFILTLLAENIQLPDIPFMNTVTQSFERLQALFTELAEYAANYSWLLEALYRFWLDWGPYLRLMVCSGIIFLVAALIVLRLRSHRIWRDPEIGDDDLGPSREDLLNGLRKSLRERFEGLGRFFSREPGGDRQRLLAAAQIRRIYTHLTDLAAELGQPRLEAQTPREFLPALEKLFLGLEEDVELITEAYLRIRYGELPETTQEVRAVEESWTRIQDRGKDLKKIHAP